MLLFHSFPSSKWLKPESKSQNIKKIYIIDNLACILFFQKKIEILHDFGKNM